MSAVKPTLDAALSASKSSNHHHKDHHKDHHNHHNHSNKNNNMYSLATATESSVSVVKFDDSEDRVLAILDSDSLDYKDIEELVVGFSPQRAQDILMSFRILSTLSQYLDETESWTFCLLNNYDFQNNMRQFDLDVAIVVGKRAEHLLSEINAWNIPRLKRMVASVTAYYSDEATILTILVFRIVSKYSDLEFTLQLALSRATLIKIHYEMAALFAKLPGGSESSSKADTASAARNLDLVTAYRKFVSQLLDEIESTPFESVQQELFQVVRDLRTMFSKYSDAQTLNSLEGDSPNREGTFFDLSASTASLKQGAGSGGGRQQPPIAEDREWTTEDHVPGMSMSSSTLFTNSTTSGLKSSLTEDMPTMMQAFEDARNKEEQQHTKQMSQKPHENSDNNDSLQPSVPIFTGQHTPPDTPVRKGSSRTPPEMYKNPASGHSIPATTPSVSLLSSPPSSISTGTLRTGQPQWSTQSTAAEPSAHMPLTKMRPSNPLSISVADSNGNSNGKLNASASAVLETGAMQVKMISNRMMIRVNGKYIDMQEWAATVNSNSLASSASSVTSSATSPTRTPVVVNHPLPMFASQIATTHNGSSGHGGSIIGSNSSNSVSPAGGVPAGYGFGMLFQPWLRPATKAVTPTRSRFNEDEVTGNPSDQRHHQHQHQHQNRDQHQQLVLREGTAPSTRQAAGDMSPNQSQYQYQHLEPQQHPEQQPQQQQQQSSLSAIDWAAVAQHQSNPSEAAKSLVGGGNFPIVMPRKPSTAATSSTTTLGSLGMSSSSNGNGSSSSSSSSRLPLPLPTSSATAALNSSSWIKGVIGQAEQQFEKNYTSAMDF